jgi:hypothetical protein
VQAETIAALTTAAGTLVLAVATFAATRSANRSSRLAEAALLAGLRPVLVPARLDDGRQKVSFMDEHWVMVEGVYAAAHEQDDVIYLVIPLRNAGSGIAVLQGWHPVHDIMSARGGGVHEPLEEFRMHGRDMFVPPGDLGFWQAAVRDHDDAERSLVSRPIAERKRFAVDLLYGDLQGGQRAITRFTFMPAGEDRWISSMSRHWQLDGPNVR